MNKIDRKKFIRTTGLAAAGVLFFPGSVFAVEPGHVTIKAIAFDGFPIFDPRPVFKAVDELFPEKGKQLSEIWKAKQFGYQWLRIAGNQYKDFWEITKDALDFASEECGLSLSQQQKEYLLDKYRGIDVWPDVKNALQALKEQNLKLGFLSNMTGEMLRAGIQNSNTGNLFDFVISTDSQKTFKPDPDEYQMAVDVLKLKKEEILFVAFAGWDMAGAKWFGYPTYWLNRLHAPADKLDAQPDGTGNDMNSLVDFVKLYNRK